MSKSIQIEEIKDAAIVRFARPEIRNPLSVKTIAELNGLLDKIERSDLARVVFTGTEGVFASGADLREISRLTAETAVPFAELGQSLMSRIACMTQFTIAAVDGYCFGGALDLALACQYRIASTEAVFSHPGSGLGIMTGWGGTQRITRLIGSAFSFEVFFTAARFSSSEALSMRLIDAVAVDAVSAALDLRLN